MNAADTAGSGVDPRPHSGVSAPLLLTAAAVGALCGIVYELLFASLASYLLGNPVLVFSLTVGTFLASMGLGAYLSRFFARRLLASFLRLELALAITGGVLPLVLFAFYVWDSPYLPYLPMHAAGTIAVGLLSGIELPLITRLLESAGGLRLAIARVLALDYLGALVGSVLFPLLLLPLLGIVGTGAVVGALGAGVVAVVAHGHRKQLHGAKALTVIAVLCAALLLVAAHPAQRIADRLEDRLYQGPVVTRVQSRHQRIVMTRQRHDLRLYLDGDLQFSAIDEHRYHEALVHPALSLHPHPARVLLLGAGDGLALREILKYPQVAEVVLVELDPEMIRLARNHPALARLNGHSLTDPRVTVVAGDAFTVLRDASAGRPVAASFERPFAVVLADFPDPDADAIARLYSTAFYRWVVHLLAPGGLFVTQASSPFFAPDAFFCVAQTLETVGLQVRSYTVDVPSFGPWGFHLAAMGTAPDPDQARLRVPTRFLTNDLARNLFDLPADLHRRANLRPNRLLDPVLVRYHHDPRWAQYD